LVAIYKAPRDRDAFDRHYRETHTPLAAKMPGLLRLEISRFFGAPMGEPRYYLMAEMFFDDKSAMFAALKSEQGKAAGKDVMSFAGDLVHMMFAEVDP